MRLYVTNRQTKERQNPVENVVGLIYSLQPVAGHMAASPGHVQMQPFNLVYNTQYMRPSAGKHAIHHGSGACQTQHVLNHPSTCIRDEYRCKNKYVQLLLSWWCCLATFSLPTATDRHQCYCPWIRVLRFFFISIKTRFSVLTLF